MARHNLFTLSTSGCHLDVEARNLLCQVAYASVDLSRILICRVASGFMVPQCTLSSSGCFVFVLSCVFSLHFTLSSSEWLHDITIYSVE